MSYKTLLQMEAALATLSQHLPEGAVPSHAQFFRETEAYLTTVRRALDSQRFRDRPPRPLDGRHHLKP